MKARKKKETLLLDDFFRQQIVHLDENENHFTAANYRNARQSVRRFVGEESGCFPLKEVIGQWVSDYVVYMQDTDSAGYRYLSCQ